MEIGDRHESKANSDAIATVPAQIMVNGNTHTLTLDPRSSLLDVLREQLGSDRRQEGLRPRPVRRLHGAYRLADASHHA